MPAGIDWNLISSYGIFGVLFVWLLLYVLNQNNKREDRMANRLDKQDSILQSQAESIRTISEIQKRIIELLDERLEQMRRALEEDRRPPSRRG